MGAKLKSYIGDKYGRWTVIGDETMIGTHYAYECKCECGVTRVVRSYQLRSGKSTSCGCYAAEVSRTDKTTHGMTDTPEFNSWRGMVKRCYEDNRADYSHYKGRGIKVCDRWIGKSGFANFYEDMGNRPEAHSLDRIDNDGDYTPENCRWATAKEQANNRSSNFRIVYGGVEYTSAELSKKLGIHHDTIRWRIRKWGNVISKKGVV